MSNLTVQVSDTLPLADVLQLSLALLDKQVHVYDNLNLIDNYTLFVPEISRIRVGDSFPEFTDSAQITSRNPVPKRSGDTLLLGDFSNVLLGLLLVLADQITFIDTPKLALDSGNTQTDSIVLADSVSVQLAVHITITVNDGISFTDGVTVLASNAFDMNVRNYLNDQS